MKCFFTGESAINLRTTNMDSFFAEQRRIGGKDALLAVVCDGVGSTADGAFASAYATQSLENWFYAQTDAQHVVQTFGEQVRRINWEIICHAQAQGLETASTLSTLLLLEEQYHIVHTGDSRIYCVRESGLIQLTQDDLTADGKLRQYLGLAEGLQLQCTHGPIERGCFLLCTDGFYKRMPQELLLQVLRVKKRAEMEELLAQMIQTICQRGERDNITAVLIKTKG